MKSLTDILNVGYDRYLKWFAEENGYKTYLDFPRSIKIPDESHFYTIAKEHPNSFLTKEELTQGKEIFKKLKKLMWLYLLNYKYNCYYRNGCDSRSEAIPYTLIRDRELILISELVQESFSLIETVFTAMNEKVGLCDYRDREFSIDMIYEDFEDFGIPYEEE